MKRDIFSLTAAKYLPIIHNFVFISLQDIDVKRFKTHSLKIFTKYKFYELGHYPKVYIVFCVY